MTNLHGTRRDWTHLDFTGPGVGDISGSCPLPPRPLSPPHPQPPLLLHTPLRGHLTMRKDYTLEVLFV